MNGVKLVSCELGGEAVQEFIHSATCGHKASERLMRASQTNKTKTEGAVRRGTSIVVTSTPTKLHKPRRVVPMSCTHNPACSAYTYHPRAATKTTHAPWCEMLKSTNAGVAVTYTTHIGSQRSARAQSPPRTNTGLPSLVRVNARVRAGRPRSLDKPARIRSRPMTARCGKAVE